MASCGPLVVSYTVGTGKNPGQGAGFYFIFSIGRICVYVLAGFLFFFAGRLAAENLWSGFYRYATVFGGGFLVLAGSLMAFGEKNRFCQGLSRHIIIRDKFSTFIFGVITGIAPCAPLIAVLSYIMLVSKNWMESMVYSLSFGIGTALSPVILLVLISGFLRQKIVHNRFWRWLQIICAAAIIVMGLRLVAGALV